MKATDVIMALLIISIATCRMVHVDGVIAVLADTFSKIAFPYFGVRTYHLMKGKK